MPVGQFIVSGAPGCGKTSLLNVLRGRRYGVVAEAAADVIADQQARGNAEPWTHPQFIDQIVDLQHQRQVNVSRTVSVWFFDRSPICTLALTTYSDSRSPRCCAMRSPESSGRTSTSPVSSFAGLEFEHVHRDAYRDAGYELVEIPRGDEDTRADLVERHLAGQR
jgi:predicted ATPase